MTGKKKCPQPTVEVLETFKATRDGCDVNAFPQPKCPRKDREHCGFHHDRDRVKVQEVQLVRVRFGAFTATVLASDLARLKRALPKRVTVSRHAPPAMPDFSLEARARWVEKTFNARVAKMRRADHAEQDAIDVTLPVQYPWGKS